MKIRHFSFLLLLFIFALGACESKKEEPKAPPQVSTETAKPKPVEAAPSDALAKVGDRYIRNADYEKQLAKLSPKLAESEHGRKYVVNQYIESYLIEKEAESRGLTKDPAIAAKIEEYTRSLYRNSLLQALKESQKPVSDEEAKKYFQEHEEEFIQPDRVRLSLIEVDLDKEKEINAIQKELKAGRDFAQLAMAQSKHVSAKRGGDIGFVTQKQYKGLTDVAFTMKPGEISKPFKAPTGWTIIKVTEFVKKQDLPPEEGIKRARARLEATETSKSFENLMKTLREKNQVVVYEDKIKQLQKQATAPEAPAKKAP
jgi:parvulin-like peptidyl-prolyl isomerase